MFYFARNIVSEYFWTTFVRPDGNSFFKAISTFQSVSNKIQFRFIIMKRIE